jgi:hypothetical protein
MGPLSNGERIKHEYHEGPKAGENFKKLAAAVLQKLVPHVSLLRHGKALPFVM